MAETCEIALKQIPSRNLRKQVKSFVKGDDVLVQDISGQLYSVELKRNKLVLKPEKSVDAQNSDGGCASIHCLNA
ncbi:MAG: hypothetical protein ACFFED_14840 [Candidatus Thorarchaeota archaeon]